MDLVILNIEVSDRKVKVNLSEQQWVEFFPFGKDFISNTSESIFKKDVRFIGNILNKMKSFRGEISTSEVNLLNQELIGKQVKSILN